jgi:hypothetical protein
LLFEPLLISSQKESNIFHFLILFISTLIFTWWCCLYFFFDLLRCLGLASWYLLVGLRLVCRGLLGWLVGFESYIIVDLDAF